MSVCLSVCMLHDQVCICARIHVYMYGHVYGHVLIRYSELQNYFKFGFVQSQEFCTPSWQSDPKTTYITMFNGLGERLRKEVLLQRTMSKFGRLKNGDEQFLFALYLLQCITTLNYPIILGHLHRPKHMTYLNTHNVMIGMIQQTCVY
jgi:hypothetical protein